MPKLNAFSQYLKNAALVCTETLSLLMLKTQQWHLFSAASKLGLIPESLGFDRVVLPHEKGSKLWERALIPERSASDKYNISKGLVLLGLSTLQELAAEPGLPFLYPKTLSLLLEVGHWEAALWHLKEGLDVNSTLNQKENKQWEHYLKKSLGNIDGNIDEQKSRELEDRLEAPPSTQSSLWQKVVWENMPELILCLIQGAMAHGAAHQNREQRLEVIERLVKLGGPLSDIQTSLGSPLHAVMLKGGGKIAIQAQLLEDFIACGMDVNVSDRARENGDGLDNRASPKEYGSALMAACILAKHQLMRVLITHGADVHTTAAGKNTPAHWLCIAIIKGEPVLLTEFEITMKAFLDAGANLRAVNDQGLTPADIFRVMGHHKNNEREAQSYIQVIDVLCAQQEADVLKGLIINPTEGVPLSRSMRL